MADLSLNPYLFFPGNAREAMEFYKEVFGGELTLQTYADVPDSPMKMEDNMLMHADLNGQFRIFASDTKEAADKMAKVSLCIGGDDEEGMREIFTKLSEGGKISQDLKKEMWGDIFGAFTDKFGVEWMMNIAAKKA